MKFRTKSHQYYCAIDLRARSLYFRILDSEGSIYVHKNIKAGLEPLLTPIQPILA